MPINTISRRDIFALIVILLLAGWMRLNRAGVVEYFHDDAMLSTLALEMVNGETFSLTGILSSTGIPNPPTSVYTMAIPFSLSSDPNLAIHFIMIWNVIGVGLLWLIAHRYFGWQIAIFAGLAYALNPWAVLFSRKIWAQDFHTPLILLGLLLALYGFCEAPERENQQGLFSKFNRYDIAQLLSFPILLFAFQIHFASWALIPLFPLVLWLARKQISWRAMALSFMLSILVMMPYLIGLTRTLDADPERISAAAERSEINEGLHLSIKPIVYTHNLVSGLGIETWVAPEQQAQLAQNYPSLSMFFAIFTVLLLVGIIGLWRDFRRFFPLVMLWAFLPQLLLIPAWTPVYAHYFIPCIPALLLLGGIGFDFLLKHLPQKPIIQAVSWLIMATVFLLQIIWWNRVLDYVESQHIAYPGFTTPIEYLNRIKNELQTVDDVIVISQGMSWNLHHEVAVWSTLLWDDVRCERTILPDGYAVFPDHAFTVLIAPDAPENPIANLYQNENPSHYPTRRGDKGYTRYDWDQSPEWSRAQITIIDPVQIDNGVQIIGYGFAEGQIYLEWRLPQQKKGADFQYSAQLLNAKGERIAQVDKSFWHGRHWCDNDRLITWGDLSRDDSATILRVSMYSLGTGKDTGQLFGTSILDVMGNPAGNWIDIPIN